MVLIHQIHIKKFIWEDCMKFLRTSNVILLYLVLLYGVEGCTLYLSRYAPGLS